MQSLNRALARQQTAEVHSICWLAFSVQGVSPSRATLDLVQQNIPLTDKHIKTTSRARGHVTDELSLSVPAVTHTFRSCQVINPSAVLQLGLPTREAGKVSCMDHLASGGAECPAGSRYPLCSSRGRGQAEFKGVIKGHGMVMHCSQKQKVGFCMYTCPPCS